MAGDTGVAGRVMAPFCLAKSKIGNKGKRERVSRQKLLKCYHQVLNVPVLAILEHLEFKIFLVDQPWWPTILFSVSWPFHFEIHFAGPGLVIMFQEF